MRAFLRPTQPINTTGRWTDDVIGFSSTSDICLMPFIHRSKLPSVIEVGTSHPSLVRIHYLYYIAFFSFNDLEAREARA
jgi:hypothetical protein